MDPEGHACPRLNWPSTASLEHRATASSTVEGRMPWSSNGTFLVEVVRTGDERRRAVYKPDRGERPLWDFPTGL